MTDDDYIMPEPLDTTVKHGGVNESYEGKPLLQHLIEVINCNNKPDPFMAEELIA
jgi:hypothetical protein